MTETNIAAEGDKDLSSALGSTSKGKALEETLSPTLLVGLIKGVKNNPATPTAISALKDAQGVVRLCVDAP